MEKEFYNEGKECEASGPDYVWYAAYGSNINKTRFMRYIEQCSDKTAPVEEKPYIFPHNIYFASESRLWENKGTAFLDDLNPGMAYGRSYKITMEQFLEVKKKEGRKYSKQVYLGSMEGFPVYTFTTAIPYEIYKEPGQAYMQVIREGLKEVYPKMSERFINIYLYTRDILKRDDISILAFIRHSPHGVSIKDMTQTGVAITRVKEIMRRLYDLNLVKQDSRSIAAGQEAFEERAIYYTRKENREVVDTILLFSASVEKACE